MFCYQTETERGKQLTAPGEARLPPLIFPTLVLCEWNWVVNVMWPEKLILVVGLKYVRCRNSFIVSNCLQLFAAIGNCLIT